MQAHYNPSLSPNDGHVSPTIVLQQDTEITVMEEFRYEREHPIYRKSIKLRKRAHVRYLLRGLEGLDSCYSGLDASRPWIVYWITNALYILDAGPDRETQKRIIGFLSHCQNEEGGYAGGPEQLSHLAPSYAAINTIALIGTADAYESVNTSRMYSWLLSLKQPDGSFILHADGESDVRGTYCALSIASLLGILTPELTRNTAKYVSSCQSYEGGLSGTPGAEAHGGYAFCGLAAMHLLDAVDMLDGDALLHWVVHRQMRIEGGFQGRTNKLVDSCYSFWQGAVLAMLPHGVVEERVYDGVRMEQMEKAEQMIKEFTQYVEMESPAAASRYTERLQPFVEYLRYEGRNVGSRMMRQYNLQEYILSACQARGGGLMDKPEKGRDYYHTNYALCGLSIAQHNPSGTTTVLGEPGNLVNPINPVHGIVLGKAKKMKEFFLERHSKANGPPL